MWPYTNDEAGWLTPPKQAERKDPGSANDNDAARKVPPRPLPDALPAPEKPTAKREGLPAPIGNTGPDPRLPG